VHEVISKIDSLSFPHEVNLFGDLYYVVKDSDDYRLISTVCPHQGARIELIDDTFVCPVHNWQFDLGGCGKNVKNQKMYSVDLVQKNESLFVDPIELNTCVDERLKTRKTSPTDIDFKLHAHACLEIIHEGFSILTDPWLDGPAFLGSWIQNPKPKIKIADLSPDIIWISHEHSDHFHENSISQFDRNIPIYFPDFPNKRIESKLKEMGFLCVCPMTFGTEYAVNEKVTLTCYEPESVWNDSMVHINVNGFNILNINDAGVNHKVKKHLPPIDLLCSSFSPGASGYPLCWNMTEEQEGEYYETSKRGMIEMLRHAMEMYDSKFLLPFASHFKLQVPEHQNYDKSIGKNTLNDVTEQLEQYNVVDLMPGESWNSKSGVFNRLHTQRSRGKGYQQKTELFNLEEFKKFHPAPNLVFDRNLLQEYILDLNKCPEVVHCEEIQVELNEVLFYIENGKIELGQIKPVDLSIRVPDNVLFHIVRNDISWDEAHIGYWCSMKRVGGYNQNFWRLLQAPYYVKSSNVNTKGVMGKSMRLILDSHPKSDTILKRYGLYCSGCESSYRETLDQAVKYHGLSESQIDRLQKELSFLFRGVK